MALLGAMFATNKGHRYERSKVAVDMCFCHRDGRWEMKSEAVKIQLTTPVLLRVVLVSMQIWPEGQDWREETYGQNMPKLSKQNASPVGQKMCNTGRGLQHKRCSGCPN